MIPIAPPPVELPANVIAIVSNVPQRIGTITKAEFQRALVQAAAARARPVPHPVANGYGKLKIVVVGELLDAAWIRGQAMEMGIGIRRRQVRRELARLRRAAFANGAEYRRFLKEAHYTRRDVSERVEIQIISTKILERIEAGLTSESAKRKAFRRFIAEYEATWPPRTVCARDYAIVDRCAGELPVQ